MPDSPAGYTSDTSATGEAGRVNGKIWFTAKTGGFVYFHDDLANISSRVYWSGSRWIFRFYPEVSTSYQEFTLDGDGDQPDPKTYYFTTDIVGVQKNMVVKVPRITPFMV